MDAIRSHSLLDGPSTPVWTDLSIFQRVFLRQRFRFFLWENALRRYVASVPDPDRRGIVLGSAETLYLKRHRVLGLIRDVLGLRETPGWQARPPAYAESIMDLLYRDSGHCSAWIMLETFRERIQQRHTKLKDGLHGGRKPELFHRANTLHSRHARIELDAGLTIPSRSLRFAFPGERDEGEAHLFRTKLQRQLWVADRALPSSAYITNWCVAESGADDSDLEKGFAPCGLQCIRPGGFNEAKLIMWYRFDTRNPMRFGFLDSYAVDIDAASGQLLSLRHQCTNLRTACGIDPWLNDWLTYGLRHF